MTGGSPKARLDLNQRRYQLLLDSIQDAVMIDDLEGRVIFANKVFLELFGVREEDLGALVLEDYVAPEWRQRLRERHDARVRGEAVPSFFECEGLKSSGERLWLQVSVLPFHDDAGNVTGTQSAIRDISEHKRAQAALGETYGLFEKAQDAIVVFDPKTRGILDANAAAVRLYGRAWGELVAGPVTRLFKTPDESFAALSRALVESPAPAFRDVHVDAGGAEHLIEVSASRIEYLGRVAVLSINRDITERTRLEEQLFRAQKMEALGELSGSVAHDFNNALSSILSNAELLQSELAQRGEDTALALEIQEVARGAGQLTRQLMDFARSRSNKPGVTGVHEVLEGAVSMLSRLVPKRIGLELATGAEFDHVYADPSQLQELITILVLNARDAIADRGSIRVTTTNRDEAPSAGKPARRLVDIVVSDTGHGMEPATLAQVFDPFFTTKPAGLGTGLGLATAYRIATQNRGEIRAESAAGKGSTFTVSLPVFERSATIPITSAPRRARSETATLLLVDDEPAVLRATTLILQGAGHVVLPAKTAEEARNLFRQTPKVDLVLLDVLMPGQSGPDLGRELRAERPDLPILFLSGFVASDIKLAGLEGSEFLAKPFTALALRNKVRAMLER